MARPYPPRVSIKMVRVIQWLLLLFILVLAGCVPVAKRESAPLQLPDNFSQKGEIQANTKWWLDFQDNELNNLIEKAFADNFNLLSVRDRIIEARAAATQAGASLYPSLDGRAAGSATRDYSAGNTSESYILEFAASYELDLWGRLRSTKNAALLELQATEGDFHTSTISLAAEVAGTWYELIETTLQIQLLEEQKKINTKVLQVITAQFRSGKAGIADVLQQRQLIESNSASIASLFADKQLLQHQLNILLGNQPRSDIDSLSSTAMSLPRLSPLPETGIPLELLSRRPDIQSSLLRVKAADYEVAAAIANRLPSLSISADLYSSGSSTSDLFDDWFTNLGANLFGPIFDAGYRKAEVDKTSSQARQQYYSYGQTVLEALAEVENSLVTEEELQTVLKSQELQRKLASETIEHVATRYRQGAEDYQRVLLALISHQNLERDILTTTLSLIDNRIALHRALSGRVATVDQNEFLQPLTE